MEGIFGFISGSVTISGIDTSHVRLCLVGDSTYRGFYVGQGIHISRGLLKDT